MTAPTATLPGVARIDLTGEEVAQALGVVADALRLVDTVEDAELYRRVPLLTRHLPERLALFLDDFRLRDQAGACVIGGWRVDDGAIGPTPGHWRGRPGRSPALPEEVYLVVLASVLGDVYAWSTVQDGRLVQDLVPIRGEDQEKNGNSSDSLLELHSEDAFSAYRCDYLGLMCLRNDDAVPTTYASVEEVVLSPEQRRVLAEPRFVLLPDPEHLRRAAERGGSSVVPDSPPRTGVLFDDLGSPYLVVDGFFVRTDPGDTEARDALDALLGQLERHHHEVALRPGEVLFVDNYRAVHGRKLFRARYDGRDRWLKRVSVTRDLRKSRAVRASADSRVLG